MANKTIADFNRVTALNDSDIFLINHQGETSTTSLSTVRNSVLPTGSNGQVLTYNGSTSTWVASALSTGIQSGLLSGDGYQKFSNGLTLMWGSLTGLETTDRTVSFPIAFSNACFTVVPFLNIYSAGPNWSNSGWQLVSFSLTGFRVTGAIDSRISAIRYIAVGG